MFNHNRIMIKLERHYVDAIREMFEIIDFKCECQEKSRPRAGKKVDHL